MTGRRLLALVTGAVAALAMSTPAALAPSPVHAAEYTLETVASYVVLPNEKRIDVTVEARFENTTPNPPGQFSVFEVVDLAVHGSAAEVAARDDQGELTVSVADHDGVRVASVQLRDGVRHGQEAAFTLTYRLVDGPDPRLRVRPSLVVFPAWSFGTSGEVRVTLPAGYEVHADGDPMQQGDDADAVVLHADVSDPGQWLSLLTATRAASYTTLRASVPLSGGTADVSVLAFADDEPWGERIRDLVERALPRLEAAVGIPYDRVGPLIVRESVAFDASGFAEEGAGTEVLVAYDQPDFTVLHQLAHLWIDDDLAGERWIAEGLASHLAARVASELDVSLPFDPRAAMAEAAADAFPLASWPLNGTAGPERYGYAASWALVDELAAADAEALAATIEAAAAGIGAYDETAPATGALTSRSFLDHLEQRSKGQAFASRFEALVLGATDTGLLDERAAARDEYASLVRAAGDWGAPDPVRVAMSVWDFAAAGRAIEDARTWLVDRDRLMREIEAAGLAAPDRLAEAYRAYGGGAEAQTELAAERAVVEAYARVSQTAQNQPSFLERLGLFGMADPGQRLIAAHGRFADGDLPGAALAISEARHGLATAEMNGLLRLASLIALVVILGIVAWLMFRRRGPRGPATARATLRGR